MRHLYIIMRQFLMTMVAIILVVGTAATLSDAFPYLFSEESYAAFFGERDPDGEWFVCAYFHIAPAIVALMIGPFQLSSSMRDYLPGLHRINGWIYVLSITISAGGALALAPFALGGPMNGLGFAMLAVLWMFATFTAIRHVIDKRIRQHQNWMMRSYALTMAGVILRIELVTLQSLAGWSFEEAYAFAAWASWIPTLIALELWIRMKRGAGKITDQRISK